MGLNQDYSDKDLTNFLVKISKKLNHTLKRREYDKHRGEFPHSSYIRKRFGTWNKFIELSGLKLNKKVGHSKQEILFDLKDIYNKLGYMPNCHKFNEEIKKLSLIENKNYPTISTVMERFGGWNNALKEAKIPINRKRYNTDQEMLSAIRSIAKKLGKTSLQLREYEKNKGNLPSGSRIYQRFKGWNNALRIAGLKIENISEYSKEQIIQKIRDFYQNKGYIPKPSDLRSTRPTYITIMRVLSVEKWVDVLKICGFSKSEYARIHNLAKVWENFIIDCCKEIYPDAVHPNIIIRNNKRLRPDVFLTKRNKIIDAKTSDYTRIKDSYNQIEDYLKITKDIEYWCLYNKNKKKKDSRIKYVFADEIYQILTENNLNKLAIKCKKFIDGEESIREESGLYTKKILESKFIRFSKENKRFPSWNDFNKKNSGFPKPGTYSRIYKKPWSVIRKELVKKIKKK